MATAAVPVSSIRELTLRGIILGALITVVFTAANVYLGLRIGLTFATSIPALPSTAAPTAWPATAGWRRGWRA